MFIAYTPVMDFMADHPLVMCSPRDPESIIPVRALYAERYKELDLGAKSLKEILEEELIPTIKKCKLIAASGELPKGVKDPILFEKQIHFINHDLDDYVNKLSVAIDKYNTFHSFCHQEHNALLKDSYTGCGSFFYCF